MLYLYTSPLKEARGGRLRVIPGCVCQIGVQHYSYCSHFRSRSILLHSHITGGGGGGVVVSGVDMPFWGF